MAASIQTGATHSLSFPISSDELCNSRGQIYTGPSILITDALCYSATDVFAASFEDHEIGPVLGIHEATGAGGANVWSHAVLCRLGEKLSVSPYLPLPNGADLRVAMRRILRVRKNAGALLEDFGVTPTNRYRMTRRDLLESNVDLIAEAARLLASLPSYRLDFGTTHPRTQVEFVTGGLDRVDVFLDDCPRTSLAITKDGKHQLAFSDIGIAPGTKGVLRVVGFVAGKVVAARKLKL